MLLELAGLEGDFRIGEWQISPALNHISCNGAAARVEPKAMRVLVYLAEHPGVISKEQLIAAVWPDVFVSDDVLPGCISALRKALGDDARKPKIIETIHKGGYRLKAPVEFSNGNGRAPTEVALIEVPWWRRVVAHRLAFAISAVLVAVLIVAAFARALFLHRYDSVAVLPFIETSGDVPMQYLSDGIAEQVINDLSQLSNLRVMAWTTVSRYRRPQLDVRAAGRELGVKAVLAAKLTRETDRVIVQAELVDVRGGSQLWGKEYERNISDVRGLQQQLSEDIASNLRIHLTGTDQDKIQHHYNASPAAYELYLKGRFYWDKRTKQGLDQAIDYFQQAIRLDPNYALAYAGLADSYALLDDWGETAPRDCFPKARVAAEKAIALDDSLAEAHVSLAMVRQAYDWDWVGAQQEFKRAIALNPNYATAHQWYGLFLASLGEFPEAEAEILRARELEPYSAIINMALPEVYTSERRYDEAIVEYKKLLAMDPSFAGTYGNLAYVYEKKKMFAQALEITRRKGFAVPDPAYSGKMQRAYAAGGFPAVLREGLKEDLQDRAGGKYVNALGIAATYIELGDEARAIEWLEKGYEEHSSKMQYLATDPQFDPLRSNPRFQYWLDVLGLPKLKIGEPARSADLRTIID
jgi:TolB-like protein/DNA-binding winged helix-turn-helix (wHTH) protein/Tfp pilus assembly protein PilF